MTPEDLRSIDRAMADALAAPTARHHHLRLAGAAARVSTGDDRSARLIENRFGHLLGDVDERGGPVLAIRVGPGPTPSGPAPGVHRLVDGGVAVVEAGRQAQVFRPGVGVDLLVTDAGWDDIELTSYPMATALASWAVASGLWPVHAAAVAFDGRGVLLVGDSGAGKSTSALACALAGAELLGDDLCIVDPTRRVVHSWYGTVKVHSDSAAILGISPSARLGINPMGKSVIAVRDLPAVEMVSSAPLHAIVVLRSPDPTADRRVPNAAQAVTALRPTALPVPGGLGPWLRDAATIVGTVPTVELPLLPSLDDMVAAIDDVSRGDGV